MFDEGIAAAQPEHCVPPYLPVAPKGRVVILGADKASAAMARAVENRWQGELQGLVVMRHGYAVPCAHVEIVEASHPVPDAAGVAVARRIYELARLAGPDDAVLCLISGGGSALLPLPLDGILLEDKQAVTPALLRSGATISEINCVRRRFSAIKGGRLAAAPFLERS
jgi:glycerate 2-kinase